MREREGETVHKAPHLAVHDFPRISPSPLSQISSWGDFSLWKLEEFRPVSLNLGLWAADLERTVALSCQQDKRVQATGANIAQQKESIQCRVAVVPSEQGREGNLGRVAAAAGAGGGWWKKCRCT